MGETKTTNTTDGRGQTAVLVAVMNDRQDETQVTEYLDELEFLAETAGVRTLKRFVQRLANPNHEPSWEKGNWPKSLPMSKRTKWIS